MKILIDCATRSLDAFVSFWPFSAHRRLTGEVMNMRSPFVGFLLIAAGVLPAATTDDLFNDDVLHEVRLTLDPSDWRTLKVNYLTDTYYKAAFQWGGQRVENVGIRSRVRQPQRRQARH